MSIFDIYLNRSILALSTAYLCSRNGQVSAYLSRDLDSLFSVREVTAVTDWLQGWKLASRKPAWLNPSINRQTNPT